MPVSEPKKKQPKPFATGKSAGQQSVTIKAKDPDLQYIPAVVKHMALAIFKNKFENNTSDFKTAFAIARGLLTDYKHLTPGSKNGAIGKIHLTGSGRLLESKHRREQGSAQKSAKFDLLYLKHVAVQADKPSSKAQEGGTKPSGEVGSIKSAYQKGVAEGYAKATK